MQSTSFSEKAKAGATRVYEGAKAKAPKVEAGAKEAGRWAYTHIDELVYGATAISGMVTIFAPSQAASIAFIVLMLITTFYFKPQCDMGKSQAKVTKAAQPYTAYTVPYAVTYA